MFNKKYIIFSTIIIVILISNCSGLLKLNNIERNNWWDVSQNWYKSNIYYSYINFDHKIYWDRYDANNITVYICPSPRAGNILFTGIPYYISFFPNIFYFTSTMFKSNDNFYVDMLIVTKNDEYFIDMSGFSFSYDSIKYKTVLKQRKVFLDNGDSTCSDKTVLFYHPIIYDDLKEIEYSNFHQDIIAVKNDTISFRFEFVDYLMDDIKKIEIKFGEFKTENTTLKIPDLIYEENIDYLYLPVLPF